MHPIPLPIAAVRVPLHMASKSTPRSVFDESYESRVESTNKSRVSRQPALFPPQQQDAAILRFLFPRERGARYPPLYCLSLRSRGVPCGRGVWHEEQPVHVFHVTKEFSTRFRRREFYEFINKHAYGELHKDLRGPLDFR